MAAGEFYTYNIWELRAGHQGRELEELTQMGIIPQYGRVEGVRGVKLYRIDEGDNVGRYLAVTIYESREAYNRWFTSNSREFNIWAANVGVVNDRWTLVADRTSSFRATLMLDHVYESKDSDEPPPPANPSRPQLFF